jgi:flagellar L-ring protein precursor FlgH
MSKRSCWCYEDAGFELKGRPKALKPNSLRARGKGIWHASIVGSVLALVLTVQADSLWRDDLSRPVSSDKRATAVGDILTIVVQENSVTTKAHNTKTAKKTGLDASLASFFYSPGASGLLTKKGQMPAVRFNSQHDFDGGGSINNSEQIIARITVNVIDVLPNRNLVIEGKRQTAFAGETQDVILRGVVRPEDVTANNTVFSYNIADATIKFSGKGVVTDTQRKGWFTRVWEKLTPF